MPAAPSARLACRGAVFLGASSYLGSATADLVQFYETRLVTTELAGTELVLQGTVAALAAACYFLLPSEPSAASTQGWRCQRRRGARDPISSQTARHWNSMSLIAPSLVSCAGRPVGTGHNPGRSHRTCKSSRSFSVRSPLGGPSPLPDAEVCDAICMDDHACHFRGTQHLAGHWLAAQRLTVSQNVAEAVGVQTQQRRSASIF